MVPFAGWEMPVQYTGVIDEHLAVRSACGLFDVSHMGEIEVSGDSAIDFVQFVMTNDIERVKDGQCQYSPLCREDGGVVDDTIVYRFNIDRYLFVVNASNTAKVLDWFKQVQKKEAFPDLVIEDLSGIYAQIALQGPKSAEIIKGLLDVAPSEIKTFHFHMGLINDDIEALVSRTGYTGEDGFEVFAPADMIEAVWDRMLEVGAAHGLQPAGLGARDTLRTEMGYPLYGHELSEDLTPLEAGLGAFVSFEKGEFLGRQPLVTQKTFGVARRCVAFRV
ncbi:partial aminomethyltransferase, partial [uncultured bacterium]